MIRTRKTSILCLIFTVLVATGVLGLPGAADALTLTSPAIAPGAIIATQYACDGADNSPPLGWSDAPPRTESFVLIVRDPDAPSGVFVHWMVYNVPPGVTNLPAAVAHGDTIPEGGLQGKNSFRKIGYNGPCPPSGSTHHYHFVIYALDSMLNLAAGASPSRVESAISGHVLASAELVGIFSR